MRTPTQTMISLLVLEIHHPYKSSGYRYRLGSSTSSHLTFNCRYEMECFAHKLRSPWNFLTHCFSQAQSVTAMWLIFVSQMHANHIRPTLTEKKKLK